MGSRTAHTPERSCRVCRTKAFKRELERWVVVSGQLVLDKKQVLSSRGTYTCRGNCSTQIDRFIGSRRKSKKVKK